MNSFNDELHTLTLSDDGSYTAYSKEYDEHYHSTKDGALHESLQKHVLPAFKLVGAKKSVSILDICYGLGFNALATLYHHQQNALNSKLYIYSPELDGSLVKSLKEFIYPEEFEPFREIIIKLSEDGVYEDEKFYIELFVGDAREYVRRFEKKFDIVYQDAFSPSTNPILWTKEYFSDISRAIKEDGIVTSYSTAFKTRLALYENGFKLYENRGEGFRVATLASKSKLQSYKEVDMEHKIACNKEVLSLRDASL